MDKSGMPKPPDYPSLYSLALTYLNVRIWKMKTTKKIKKKKKKKRIWHDILVVITAKNSD